MREPRDEHEAKTIADVLTHGWHVLKVLEDDAGPGFAYTVGLRHSFGHPELIVVGLAPDVGHALLNLAGESIRQGGRYAEGIDYDDLLRGHACRFRDVPVSQFRPYLGWALWFYEGPSFPALQLIWPDPDGRWPWDPAVDPAIRDLQPVIADQGGS